MKLTAAAITPRILSWLRHNHTATLLHSSPHTCNLIDQRGHVLSLVTAEIGRGPFALVLPVAQFPPWSPGMAVAVTPAQLVWADWQVDVAHAPVWEPRPQWETVSPHLPLAWPWVQEVMERQANPLPVGLWPRLQSGIQQVFMAVRGQDAAAMSAAMTLLAGFGPGLTPAGDDCLLGLFYGLWVRGGNGSWLRAIAEQAGPRTTTLSAQFLLAAADGEAVESWHHLVAAICTGEKNKVQKAAQAILAIGASSGYCALFAFGQAWG